VRSFVLLLAGCAASAATPGPAPLGDAELASWEETRTAPSSQVLRRERLETTRVAPRRPPSRARRGRRVDLEVHRAPLTEAVRFLADAAGVNVVVGEGVHGEVTTRMRHVHPLDALEAIAQAHGAHLEWRGEILLVTQR